MQVTTSAIINGEFADKYGKRGSQFSENGMPTYSIPFEISGAPEQAVACIPTNRVRGYATHPTCG